MEEEKIAIVGIGCRFPGADDIDKFWQVLVNGENHVIEVPEDRWNLDVFYDEDPGTPGKTNVRRAGFCLGHDEWDYKLFSINEFESLKMDPQHKFVLDCTYMAMENAGITRKEVKGSNTGVYIGMMNADFSANFGASFNEFDNYTITGTNNSIVSSRVSYVFDLRGPSMTIDTACSSSLIAIHHAHQALLSGECDMAVAGGVNALLKPDTFIQLSKAGMVSPTGQCQAFSENADGYARGEGCGIVVLKTLKKALEDNNPIWATISTASNHDGHSVSPITTPSLEQQIKLLDLIFDRFHVDRQTVDYIEAHGTGTKAGDPIEVNSLGTFFQSEEDSTPKIIGSVKTNIGHLESAAGVAGLIKVLLMQKHRLIVPTLHFERPNEDVPLEKYKFTVPVENMPWPDTGRDYLRSSVNSFSFGGSNCHAIVTSPSINSIMDARPEPAPRVVCISAIEPASLTKIKDLLCEKGNDYHIDDLSYTSTMRRDHYPCRIGVSGQTTEEMIKNLQNIDVNEHIKKFNPTKGKKYIFVFAGMGTNWEGMCQQLLKRYSEFRSTIEEISKLLKQYVSWDLYDYLRDGFDLDDANITPIMTFACEVGLFVLLRSFGIHPDAILGQSIGEVAAAFAAGAVNLEQAVYIIYHRTRVQAEGTGGKMFVAKNMAIDKVESVLENYQSQANIAVYSSPHSCTISCDEEVLDDLKKDISEADSGVMLIDLVVTSAFHSHHMAKSSEDMKLCDLICGQEPEIALFSTTTGTKAEPNDFITADYWADNIRKPVKLYQAVLEAHDPQKLNVFVEVGPRPILRSHLPSIFEDDVAFDALPVMNINDDLHCIAKTVANFYQHGVEINWEEYNDFKANVVDLPRYQFLRVKNMFLPTATADMLQGIQAELKQHPFVRSMISNPNVIKVVLDPSKIPSIYEHKVNGLVMIPGAFHAEVGLAIPAIKSSTVSFRSVTVDFKNPILLLQRESRDLEAILDVGEDETNFSVTEGQNVYCSGSIKTCFDEAKPLHIEDIKARFDTTITAEKMYADLGQFGFSYGKAMSILKGAERNDHESLVELELNELLKKEMDGTILHPAIIDSMLQATASLILENGDYSQVLPIHIAGLRVHGELKDNMYVHVERSMNSTETKIRYKLSLCSLTGSPIATIDEFTVKILGENDKTSQKLFYEQNWKLMTPSKDIKIRELFDKKFVTVSVDKRESYENEINVMIPLQVKNKDLAKLQIAMEKNRHVVIFIEVRNNEKNDPSAIQNMVTEYMLWLKDILEVVNDSEEECRVVVCINNTWSVEDVKSNTSILLPINSIQMAIWGSVRTMQRELSSMKIHLVDLHEILDQTDNDLLTSLFTDFESTLRYQAEMVVDPDGTFGYQYRFMDDRSVKTYPSFKEDNFTNVDIFSSSKTEVKDVFLVYAKGSTVQKRNSILLDVSMVNFQDPVLFLPVLGSYQQDGDFGWPVCCLETVGVPAKRQKNTFPLVCCYPVQASNRVAVPLSCCLPLSSLPSYRPGVLTTLVSLWTLVSLVKDVKTREVIILEYNKYSFCSRILIHMLALKRVKPLVMTPEELEHDRKTGANIVILLTEMDQYISEIIVARDPIDKVIAFSCLISSTMSAFLNSSLKSLSLVRINEYDMFSLANISTAVHGLGRLLKRKGKLIKEVLDNSDPRPNLQDPVEKLFAVRSMNFAPEDRQQLRHCLVPGRLMSKTAAYIVIGGLTGLGWECVQWLARQNAGYILCFNRRKPNDDDKKRMSALSDVTACSIKTYSTDVTDLTSVEASIVEFTMSFPHIPIKGVFHGAGVLRDSSLFKMTSQTINEVLSPKILGAWNLHQATTEMKLDFFIMHSSITAVLGSPGQSNYGAGNAFQDSLVFTRRQMGLPAQSINWGPLDMGMLEKGDKHDRTRIILAGMGYNLISKQEIGNCMEKVLLSNKPQIMVCDFDLDRLREGLDAVSDFFTVNRLQPVLPKSRFEISEMGESDFAHILKDAQPKDRPQLIETYLTKLLAKILSLSESLISSSTTLVDAGMDSMLAMTLVNQIKKDIEVKVPLNLLFATETSVGSLSKFIEAEYCGENASQEEEEEEEEDNFASMSEHRYLQLYNTIVYKAYHLVHQMTLLNVFDFMDSEFIVKFIKKIMVRHPITTAVFNYKEDLLQNRKDITKTYVDVDEACDILEVLPDDENAEEIFQNRRDDRFDLKTKGPSRFTFTVCDTDINLDIVLNHVGFDLMAVNIFLMDFVSCMRRVCMSKMTTSIETLPSSISSSQHKKTVGQILQHILDADYKKMSGFWEKEFEKGVPHLTLDVNRQHRPRSDVAPVASIGLEQETQETIDALTKMLGTTPFKLYISLYQLLLSIRSKSDRVFITSAIDVRQYSMDLQNRVEAITNHVPFFTDIPEKNATFIEFIKQNSDFINSTIESAVFPYTDMAKLVPQGQNKDLYRHLILFNDISFTSELERQKKSGGLDLQIKDSNPHSSAESTLVVSTDRNTNSTSFKLMMGGEEYDELDADELLQDFMMMLQTVTADPEVTIQQLKQQFKPKLAGHFKKETWKGLSDIGVKFERDPCDDLVITIGKRTISSRDIKSIYRAGAKQLRALVIKSMAKEHRLLYDNNDPQIVRLIDRLEKF